MRKTIYSQQSELLQKFLVELREQAGLTQRQLAGRLKREHNLVGRLELGERRLDVVEFYQICKACDANPVKEASRLMQQFDAIQSKTENT